ncbi:MAG: ABC transporter permease [Bacteroidales bacterium]|nr:ABC transporter permease [Bacteroidales bacterium]
MIKNIFRTVFRNISRQKGYTFINIAGLAVGLAAALLILMWVMDEFSYETFNEQADQIFMVNQDQFYSGERYRVSVTPYPCAPVWQELIPELQVAARMVRLPRFLFRFGTKTFYESSVMAADSGLFDIFTLPVLQGDAKTTLGDPHGIVLNEKLAKKYFGDENPIGQTIELENKTRFTVGAVMQDLPKNSRFTFEAILPYEYVKEIGMASESWGNNSIYTFVLVNKGADLEAVNQKLTAIVREHNPESNAQFFLFPLLDIKLYSSYGFGDNQGAILRVYIFIAITVFIILIACINFINLATAKASVRAKEIGVKKASGASRTAMIVQFMIESLVLAMMALVVAIILVALSLGVFNSISGKSFSLTDIFQLNFVVGFLITGIVTGILAGIYPAFYLSSLKPVLVLKGETMTGRRNGWLRRVLVVVQFTLSIFIALGAIFMYLQMKYMQEKELGFDKENMVCIPMAKNMKDTYYLLKKELLNNPLILGVTSSNSNPVMMGSNSGGVDWDGKDPEQEVLIGFNGVDYDYVSTMKMDLLAGRDFSKDFPGDLARDTTGNFLVNEEVAKVMGGGDVVGKRFNFVGIEGVIIGVLKNFHYSGAEEPIEPMAFVLTETGFLNVILVRLAPGNLPASIAALEKTWQKVIPDYPLDYSFIDQDYNELYRVEMRMGLLLKYFTIVAIIIACLGLYGLSSYAASRRTREIGVRKAMGAGVFSVIYSLSREFLILVIISIVLAFAIGWYVIGEMLNEFAYHIDMSALVFGIIAIGALILALITVSFQAFKASGINPAMALKAE